jgi:hypothetical protein
MFHFQAKTSSGKIMQMFKKTGLTEEKQWMGIQNNKTYSWPNITV